jgi:hypothetical protein
MTGRPRLPVYSCLITGDLAIPVAVVVPTVMPTGVMVISAMVIPVPPASRLGLVRSVTGGGLRDQRGRRRQPRPIETPAASRRAGCDEVRVATRSRSSAHLVPGFPRQSPPSPVLHRRRRGVPISTSTRRKLCPSIGKLLTTRSPCLDQTRQHHPIAAARRKVGIRLRLRSS